MSLPSPSVITQCRRFEVSLVGAIRMHHPPAGFCDLAAREDSICEAANGVESYGVREGELLLGAQVSLITAAGVIRVSQIGTVAGDSVAGISVRYPSNTFCPVSSSLKPQ